MNTPKKLENAGIEIMENEKTLYPKKNKKTPLYVAYLKNRNKFFNNDEILLEIATLYRSGFGRDKKIDPASWGEGFRCNDCGNKKSLENAYGINFWMPLSKMENKNTPNLDCPSCHNKMDLFHAPENIINLLRRKIDALFAGFVFDKNSNMQGFFYGYIDTLKNVCDELLYFYKTSRIATLDYFLTNIQQNANIAPQDLVLYIPDTAVEKPFRNQENFHAMSRGLFKNISKKNLQIPTITLSEKGKKGCMFIEAAGHKVACEIKDNPMLIFAGENAKKIKKSFSLSAKDFNKKYKKVFHQWEKSIK